jgi:beta-glucosidase
VADLWDWTNQGENLTDGLEGTLIEVDMDARQPVEHPIKTANEIRPISRQTTAGQKHLAGGCCIGYKKEDKVGHLQEAIGAAKTADAAIVIIGVTAD